MFHCQHTLPPSLASEDKKWTTDFDNDCDDCPLCPTWQKKFTRDGWEECVSSRRGYRNCIERRETVGIMHRCQIEWNFWGGLRCFFSLSAGILSTGYCIVNGVPKFGSGCIACLATSVVINSAICSPYNLRKCKLAGHNRPIRRIVKGFCGGEYLQLNDSSN